MPHNNTHTCIVSLLCHNGIEGLDALSDLLRKVGWDIGDLVIQLALRHSQYLLYVFFHIVIKLRRISLRIPSATHEHLPCVFEDVVGHPRPCACRTRDHYGAIGLVGSGVMVHVRVIGVELGFIGFFAVVSDVIVEKLQPLAGQLL